MRVKLISIFIILFLLSTYISVGASSDDFILEKNICCKNPFVENSKLSIIPPSNEIMKEMINDVPTAFTENRGQLEIDDVRFYSTNGGIWFTNDGVWFELREEISINSPESRVQSLESRLMTDDWRPTTRDYKRFILNQKFVGANPVSPVGREPLGYYSNFFYGNDSSKWCTEVPNYQEVFFENIYDGIDLKYYSNDNGLKYDFIVHPGADVSQIMISYEGADGLKIDAIGNLIIKTPIEDIVDGELFIYQDQDNIRQGITGNFMIFDELEYGFEITENYDNRNILVIDPSITFEFSTYIGGTGNDYARGITVDSAGNTYVTGQTRSSDFPTTSGAYDTSYNNVAGYSDVFILKLNQSGSGLIYSTFVGGTRDEIGYDIVIDGTGNAFVTGFVVSTGFPTINAYDSTFNGWGDVFILKLDPAGSNLIFSTFVGGSSSDRGFGIALDSKGNAYVTGRTYYSTGTPFPTTSGAYDTSQNTGTDVFILKLNSTGLILDYSTFVGSSAGEQGNDITLDSKGNAYVTGHSWSSSFPTNGYDTSYNGGSDAFVLKLNQNGSTLIYSTFLGGSGNDRGESIAIDVFENVIVTGYTASSNFPNTTGVFDPSHNGNNDVFVSKLNQTGSKLIFSTFIGGSGDDEGWDLVIDSGGNIYVIGDTASSTFPTSPDAFDNAYNNSEAFILKLSSDGSALIYSTYLGGTSDDNARGVELDFRENLYITGYTLSSDFPTTNGAYNRTLSGGSDVYVLKFATSPFINITSFTLLKNNQQITDIYSKLCPYTFRINIIDSVDITDINIVRLTLDLFGSNIRLKWDRATGQFSELSDPNNYVVLESSSVAYQNNYLWTIDFNVTFNWNYPDENLNDVQVFATSATFSPTWFNATNIYQVENDIVFNGTLLVKGDNNRTIYEDSLVRGGEQLNWTGLTPVYENTTDVYPPDDEFNVTIWDDEGSPWTDSPTSGEPFYAESITPNTTYNTSFTYTITLTEVPPASATIDETFTIMLSRVPPGSDKTNETLDVFIDADNVTFLNATPLNTTWQTISNVLVSVNITDIGGGDVVANSVMRSISTNNGITWSDWENILGLDSKINIIVQDVITLEEGKDNLIKWKAIDSVGNGPTISETYRIIVDTEDITFSNEWPAAQISSPTDNVEVGVTISDATSGVNVSSIEFAVSEDKGNTWSIWTPVEGFDDGQKVDVYINHTFPNGTDNRIKWRAKDIAGNGPVESPRYLINVNTWVPVRIPNVLLLSPPRDLKINTTQVELSWELEDLRMKNVTYDLYFENSTPPSIYKPDISTKTFIVENLTEGETYYWRVIPKMGDIIGTSRSGIWWFEIELPEEEIIFDISISCRNSISLYPGENKSILITITNIGSAEDFIKLELENGILSEYITLEDNSILIIASLDYDQRNLEIQLPDTVQYGTHSIIITAISMKSDEKVRDSHTVVVEIKEKDIPKPNGTNGNGHEPNGNETNVTDDKPAKRSDNILMFILVPIVIAIILFIALIAVIKKRKKLTEQALLAPGTFAIKPGTLPAPVIALDQVPAAPSAAQLPGTIGGGSQQLTVSVPQLTKSTQIVQSTISQPITQSVVPPALPQLPPAQTQVASPETIETTQPAVAISSPIPTPNIAPSPQAPEPIIDTTQTLTTTSASLTPATTQTSSILTSTTIPTSPSTHPSTPTTIRTTEVIVAPTTSIMSPQSSTPKVSQPTPPSQAPVVHLPDSPGVTPTPKVVTAPPSTSTPTPTTPPQPQVQPTMAQIPTPQLEPQATPSQSIVEQPTPTSVPTVQLPNTTQPQKTLTTQTEIARQQLNTEIKEKPRSKQSAEQS